jgi:hypothetical protein
MRFIYTWAIPFPFITVMRFFYISVSPLPIITLMRFFYTRVSPLRVITIIPFFYTCVLLLRVITLMHFFYTTSAPSTFDITRRRRHESVRTWLTWWTWGAGDTRGHGQTLRLLWRGGRSGWGGERVGGFKCPPSPTRYFTPSPLQDILCPLSLQHRIVMHHTCTLTLIQIISHILSILLLPFAMCYLFK